MGLPRTVLGILGYLVSRDPWDPVPAGNTWDCPEYPGILSTMETMWDLLGMHVILGCPMYSGMSRVVLGQTVAVLDIPRASVEFHWHKLIG